MCRFNCDCPTFENIPNGHAKASDGTMWRRFKQTGPNYSYLTPVGHDATTSGGYPCSLYRIDMSNPDKAIR